MWGVSARKDVKGIDYSNADISLGASNSDEGLNFCAKGSCSGGGFVLDKIEAKKAI